MSKQRVSEVLDWIANTVGAPLDNPASWLLLAGGVAFLVAVILWAVTA